MKTVKIYPIQNHPQDSRVIMEDGDTIQTLNAKMGTGGGNTPFVLMVLTAGETHESISTKNRGAVCEQPSGQLHGAGRIQRYAPGDRGRTR